ncbi:hypothetical protein [Streptomyces collinus]|uniref:hypothetical protein n=1 Tax=Streptomyces collinus TaxID=42684 RepID=UPI0033CBB4A2
MHENDAIDVHTRDPRILSVYWQFGAHGAGVNYSVTRKGEDLRKPSDAETRDCDRQLHYLTAEDPVHAGERGEVRVRLGQVPGQVPAEVAAFELRVRAEAARRGADSAHPAPDSLKNRGIRDRCRRAQRG